MQSVQGEIKWYQVTHSISHHYVTTGSAAAIALRTHAYTCTRALSLRIELAAFSSIYNTNTHKTQTAAAADRNWDLERLAENQKVQIHRRVFTPPSISTFFFSISLQCTLNTNGQGSRSYAALTI